MLAPLQLALHREQMVANPSPSPNPSPNTQPNPNPNRSPDPRPSPDQVVLLGLAELTARSERRHRLGLGLGLGLGSAPTLSLTLTLALTLIPHPNQAALVPPAAAFRRARACGVVGVCAPLRQPPAPHRLRAAQLGRAQRAVRPTPHAHPPRPPLGRAL